MPDLITKHPRLGLPLLLSTILSSVIIVLQFTTEPISPGFFIPIFLAINSAYYLVRYVQRSAAIQRDVLVGGEAWPIAQLFPGKAEYSDYVTSTRIGLSATISWGKDILPKKDLWELRWPEDGASIVLAGAYYFGLVISTVMHMQARSVRKAEDSVMCAVAHEMRCKNCSIDQAALDRPQTPFSTKLHAQAMVALSLSLFLSFMLWGALLMLPPAVPTNIIRTLVTIAALTAVHRTFFLARGRLRRSVEWPTYPLFPEKAVCMHYKLGNIIVFVLSLIVVAYVFRDERVAWRTGPPARIVIVMELLVLAVNLATLVSGIQMTNVEAQFACVRLGHRWKCVRWCSVALDMEAKAVGMVGVNKSAVEAPKEDGSARVGWSV